MVGTLNKIASISLHRLFYESKGVGVLHQGADLGALKAARHISLDLKPELHLTAWQGGELVAPRGRGRGRHLPVPDGGSRKGIGRRFATQSSTARGDAGVINPFIQIRVRHLRCNACNRDG